MESSPSDTTPATDDPQTALGRENSRHGTRRAEQRYGADERRRNTPVRIRLGLQQRATLNLRRHVLRAARRFIALLLADLGAFWVMREALRAVRDYGALGGLIARFAEVLTPRGILSGWQYAAALLLGLLVTGNYGRGDNRRSPKRLFVAATLATALPFWMTIWTMGIEVVAVQYVVTTLLVWAGLVMERRTVHQVVGWIYPPERSAPRTLFVGPAGECRHAMMSPAFRNPADCRPVGFVDADSPRDPDAVGGIDELSVCLHRSHAETVVVCGYLPDARFTEIVDAAITSGCQLLSVPRSTELAGVQPALTMRHGQPLIQLTAPTLQGWQLVIKRAVDLLGTGVGLVVASPVMLVAALAIRLDSPGPVFFGQERIGIGGRRFRVMKFRTMRFGASDAVHRELIKEMLQGDEAATGHGATDGKRVYKLVNDDRVTRVGRWLRKTSIDELPQLLNVLRGEMSLVGPRPPLTYEVEAYDHWQYDRLQVRPGITGLWQVSGRSLLTYRQMCELDVTYVRNWTLWLDFQILLKTIPVVLFNAGRAV